MPTPFDPFIAALFFAIGAFVGYAIGLARK